MALTISQVEEALIAADGNMSEAGRTLGVTRQAIRDRVQRSAKLQQVMEDAQEGLVDFAISRLRVRVSADDTTAIAYVLNNSPAAKRRGWGPRHEITGADGKPVSVMVVNWDATDDTD